MKNLLLVLALFVSATISAQTFIELRGGATISEHGGVIGAGISQEINDFEVGITYEAYGIGGYSSYDTYNLETGYNIGNKNFSISPTIGLGYINQRSWNEVDDSFTYVIGGSFEFLVDNYFKIGAGYRKNKLISSGFIFFKLPLIPSKKKTHRFF